MKPSALIFLIALAILPIAAHAQYNYITNNGTLTITGYTGAGGAVTIPTNINGLTVTAIGTNAFADNANITSLTIPDSVTNIEYEAFNSCHMSTVTMGNGVLSIGIAAFELCFDLTNITLGNNVTYIATNAFIYCEFTSITIPNSVTSIDEGAFAYTHLGSVMLGSGVTNMSGNPFPGCIFLPAIGVSAGNTKFTSVGGILFNSGLTTLVGYPAGLSGATYAIPNGITAIAGSAFSGCERLTNVTIPSSVISIGDFAFGDCDYLTGITIPASVTSIGIGPFMACTDLKAITVNSSSTAFTNIGGVLYNKSATQLIQYPEGSNGTAYVIPSGVTNIGGYSFAACSALTNVLIPDSVLGIGDYAFTLCYYLDHVYFESNAPVGGTNVFNLDGTTSYYLPGMSGWGPTYEGRPTALWLPLIQTGTNGPSVKTNEFGFNISWASNIIMTVQATTNLTTTNWTAVQTSLVTNGLLRFNDTNWTSYPQRFYRIMWP